MKTSEPALQHVRQRAGIVLRVGRDLGEGDMARRVDELAELAVRDRRAVDPEAVDADAMDRRLLRVVAVGAHAERSARHKDHVGERILPLRLGSLLNSAYWNRFHCFVWLKRKDCMDRGRRKTCPAAAPSP